MGYKFFIVVSSILLLLCVSSGDVLDENILIDCGSPNNTQVGGRLFQGETSSSHLLTTSESILAKANSTLLPSSFDSDLYQTARILNSVSQYTFQIKRHGRHWIRLYFFPFSFGNYNMSNAKFRVSAQGSTLLKEFQIEEGSSLKEYSLNITAGQLVLTFTPSYSSFAFINAIEVLSIPDRVFPEHVSIVSPQESGDKNLWTKALETVARVNMGNQTVYALNDTLWRLWVSDEKYLIHNNLADFVSNIAAVNFTETNITEDIAPAEVYGTATRLRSGSDPRTTANVTWLFDVDPGFNYLLRFHFCDIVRLPPTTLFNVYVNSWLVSTVDIGKVTSNKFGAPFYMDAITRTSGTNSLKVSVGTFSISETSSPEAILNGLEIMKISNTKDSLVLDSKTSTKKKAGIIVGLVIGSVVCFLVMGMASFLVCRRIRRKRRSLHNDHENGNHYDGTEIFSSSKIGYRFSLAVILEATNNFGEDLVIGTGGFGKVYKGVLRDGTKVAVKRGSSQSQQGLAQFRTEIEMLSQFRHRHLVSLIGYCNEKNERIIIYEYMENGSLKSHLFGSDDACAPCLSWKQRIEICIGAAKGLYYLHTGSASAIIHRDVKSANILLDENFMAKVADFGISKTAPEIDKTHVSTAVKGSFGYLDPEYLVTQQLTEKSDVYSFGVVMFEVLCGRPVIDPSLPREKVNLVEWIMKWHEEQERTSTTVQDIVDPRLIVSGHIKSESLQRFTEIAKKCLAQHGINRPSMGDVLWHLEYALRIESVDEERPNHVDPQAQIFCSDTALSSSNMEYSMGSVGDELSGVSMSKVFAQMVMMEDMR